MARNEALDTAKAYIEAARQRRKKRYDAKAERAAKLYVLSRTIGPGPEEQVCARLQDVQCHDWKKAHETPGRLPYGISLEDRADIGDVMDAKP